ncbi:ribosome maturation factor RimM [Hydrococcus rivularis NIES-593]|uniref:Ribosome maturation factor RimM n=1 Tax=Hydrococcus rivularis NIES-593 TaxID=1921803 RepID=A0A1U7HSY2_9CYAN|nr:ribosome maturation factor RimM [Hydrococcus rivularis]OKH26696.1 ribosome maturation factor RimM [Hydrococcus rivularis NIES-593]
MNDWLEIGTIVTPQGLKGELRVAPNSDFPERFEEPGRRWLQAPSGDRMTEVELLGGRYIPGKNLYVIQLAGVEDRNSAEELRGYKLLVRSCDRPQLAEDEYHVSDLIDLEVYNQLTGEKLGIVSDIFWAGNDLLEVKLERQPVNENIEETSELEPTESKKKHKIKHQKPRSLTVLIPFVKEIVPVVDLEKGLIEIAPPPGLLEINNF